jgi:hypothetical protein
MKLKWCIHKNKKTGKVYAVSAIRKENWKQILIYMHNYIMNTPNGMVTDHRDDKYLWWLDNHKSNLRICTASQNWMNSWKQKNNTSGFKGVYWSKHNKKWRTRITINNKQIHLWLFSDKLEAHKAYCEAATRLHGEYAHF